MNQGKIYSKEEKDHAASLAQKIGIRQAIRELGMCYATISSACKSRGITPPKNKNNSRKKDYDLELAVMHVLLEEGMGMSAHDIAEVCGVSHQAIYQQEMAALKKIRKYMKKEDWEELRDAFRHLTKRRDFAYCV